MLEFPQTPQSIRSVSRPGNGYDGDPCELVVRFARPVSGPQLLSLWILLKGYIPLTDYPEGWEPSDKSDPAQWEEV